MQLPEDVRAELVEGIVFMGSALSVEHARATAAALQWLTAYSAVTPGVEALSGATLVLDPDNEFQPDALLRLDTQLGGRSWVEGNYLHGAPELVLEVSFTSVALDLGDKLKVYRRHRVQEYVVWQLQEQRIDWLLWHEGQYLPLQPQSGGLLCSQVFPGLWLDVKAMLAGNTAKVLAQLHKGLRSAAYRRWRRSLASK